MPGAASVTRATRSLSLISPSLSPEQTGKPLEGRVWLSDGLGPRLKQLPPPHLPLNNEVLVHELHRDLSGMGVRIEALQHRSPWDRVKIVSHQEPPHAQTVLVSIWKD